MKKFVIIALIFALAAGAAFAQDGSWSVSGKGEIGTILNFAGPKQAKSELQAAEDGILLDDNAKLKLLVGANGFHNIDYYGLIGGDLFLAYQIGGLKAGLEFYNERAGSYLSGVLSYQDETRAFQYVQNLNSNDGLLNGQFKPERLWGYYKFMDGMIHLEAAYNSRDSQFFYTSGSYTPYDHGVVANLFGGSHTTSIQALRGNGLAAGTEKGYFDNKFGRGFFKVDHHNYLLAQVAPVDGLSFGVLVPSVFVSRYNKQSYYGGGTQDGDGKNGEGATVTNNPTGSYYLDAQGDNSNVPFLDAALLNSRLGVKYQSGPITISAQFALLGRAPKFKTTAQTDATGNPVVQHPAADNGDTKDITLTKVVGVFDEEEIGGVKYGSTIPVKTIETGLYLGAKYAVSDSITASLAFQGEFWSKKPQLGFGLDFGFSSGAFGAGLGAGFLTMIDPNEDIYWSLKYGTPDAAVQVGAENKSLGGGRYWFVNDTSALDNAQVKKATQSFIGVQPTVSYALVENYLMLSLDANIYWRLGVGSAGNGAPMTYERKYQQNVFGYEITPILWFNVAGTGAAKGYYSGNNNAIIFRYKVAGWIDGKEVRTAQKTWTNEAYNGVHQVKRPTYNAIDITFKWVF